MCVCIHMRLSSTFQRRCWWRRRRQSWQWQCWQRQLQRQRHTFPFVLWRCLACNSPCTEKHMHAIYHTKHAACSEMNKFAVILLCFISLSFSLSLLLLLSGFVHAADSECDSSGVLMCVSLSLFVVSLSLSIPLHMQCLVYHNFVLVIFIHKNSYSNVWFQFSHVLYSTGWLKPT